MERDKKRKTKVDNVRTSLNGDPSSTQAAPTDAFGSSALATRVRNALSTPIRSPLGTPKTPDAISLSNLEGSPKVTTPVVPPATKTSDFAAELSTPSIDSQVKTAADQYTPETAGRSQMQSTQQALIDRILNRSTKSSLEDKLYSAEVDPAQKELDDIQSQIEAKKVAYLRTVENIQKNAVGKETSGVTNAMNEAERQYIREAADLSIIESAKLRRYDTAKAIADRAVAAELERDKNEVEALTFWYQDNKEQLNREEDRRFNFMMSERSRLLTQEETRLQQISNIKLQAAQYGATPADLSKINSAKTFDEALALAGSFLGKPFELQMRAMDLQEKTKNTEIESAMLKASQEANKAFAETDAAKNFASIKGQVDQVDQLLKNIISTSDRAAITDEQWATISKDSSAVNAIVNAEARALNPDLAKRADTGDPQAQESLLAIGLQTAKKYGGGSAAAISNLKQGLRVIDSSYQARLNEAIKTQKNIEALYPNSQILTTYQQVNSVPIRAKLDEAIKSGFQPIQIVSHLQNDPVVGPLIIKSLSEGYTPLQIFEYLNTK